MVAVPAGAATIPDSASCPRAGDPVITSLTQSTDTVDVRTKSARITFTAKATDTVDIKRVVLSVASPFHRTPRPATVNLALTSGTAKDGTWTGTLTVPRFSQNGTWKITGIDPWDAGGGGWGYSTDTSSGGQDWGAGWARTYRVISKNDLTAPTVTSVKLSHGIANTTSQTQTLVATVVAGDNLSGVRTIRVSGSVTVNGVSYSTRGGLLTLVSPIAKSHAYKVSFLVPKGVGGGTHTWSLLVTFSDAVANAGSLDRAHLLAKHFTSTFKVVSKTDLTPPKLTSVSMSPSDGERPDGGPEGRDHGERPRRHRRHRDRRRPPQPSRQLRVLPVRAADRACGDDRLVARNGDDPAVR